MNREEIENRIYICEKRADSYREVGNTKVAEKYDTEKYKWEKLLSDLNLLEEKKINELLDYKKGYYNQKEVIKKAINKLGKYADELMDNGNAYAICVDLLDLLKEVSE